MTSLNWVERGVCCIKLNSRKSKTTTTTCIHRQRLLKPLATSRQLHSHHRQLKIFLTFILCINRQLSLCYHVWKEKKETLERKREGVY
jgi:hypothetical protein